MLLHRQWGLAWRAAAVGVAGLVAWAAPVQGAATGAVVAPGATPNEAGSPLLRALESPPSAPNPSPSSTPNPAPSPEHVVVVANSREPESEPLARYYMLKRHIPDKNLVLIDAPTTQDIPGRNLWNRFLIRCARG